MWASYSPDDWRQRCIGPIIGQQCRQSASGGSIFGSYLAAMAYNEDSPHCPAARGKILWRKILLGRTVPWFHPVCSPASAVITPANKAVSPACFAALQTIATGNTR